MSASVTVKKRRASASPHRLRSSTRRLSGKEVAAVNLVDALRGFTDITGAECTNTDGGARGSDEPVLAHYFPSASFRARLMAVIEILSRLFPFPKLGLSSASPILRLPGGVMTLKEMGAVLEKAVASIVVEKQIPDTDLYGEAAMDAVESLALAMELKSTLLRMALEVSALELRVRRGQRDELRRIVGIDGGSSSTVDRDLAALFEQVLKID